LERCKEKGGKMYESGIFLYEMKVVTQGIKIDTRKNGGETL
jgi:hypothetical protein